MNIFSNLGITELLIILVLALLVVGPERLPELAQQLGKALRDARRAYEKLTADLGPELTSLQKTSKELRDSVNSVRSIPKDLIHTVVQAAELDETMDELKDMSDGVGQIGKTLSAAGDAIRNPLDAAVSTAKQALDPAESARVGADDPQEAAEVASEQPESQTEDAAGE
jgi:sec-independent protein translocase protein TatB